MKAGDWILYRPWPNLETLRGKRPQISDPLFAAEIVRLNKHSVTVRSPIDNEGADALTRWVMHDTIVAVVPECTARATIGALQFLENEYASASAALETQFKQRASALLDILKQVETNDVQVDDRRHDDGGTGDSDRRGGGAVRHYSV